MNCGEVSSFMYLYFIHNRMIRAKSCVRVLKFTIEHTIHSDCLLDKFTWSEIEYFQLNHVHYEDLLYQYVLVNQSLLTGTSTIVIEIVTIVLISFRGPSSARKLIL